MFRNQFLAFVILFLFTSLAFGRDGLVGKTDDNCCPEEESIRPSTGSERIAPLKSIPTREASPLQSIAKPDAVIVPGLAAGSFPNVADMIVGRVAGVSVMGGGWNNYVVRIRGAMGPPLVVIDGMPFYSAQSDAAFNSVLQMVPTAEVASIEVLKSIAQTAIYGGQGANGVIRINTRGYVQSESEE